MEWIKVTDRLPNKSDGDQDGYVACWHKDYGFYSDSYIHVTPKEYTHWAKVEPPKQ